MNEFNEKSFNQVVSQCGFIKHPVSGGKDLYTWFKSLNGNIIYTGYSLYEYYIIIKSNNKSLRMSYFLSNLTELDNVLKTFI